jgi:hypothetical protein
MAFHRTVRRHNVENVKPVSHSRSCENFTSVIDTASQVFMAPIALPVDLTPRNVIRAYGRFGGTFRLHIKSAEPMQWQFLARIKL